MAGGETLRKRRNAPGLFQKHAAATIRVREDTFISWERGRVVPQAWFVPQIVELLGRDPFPKPEMLPKMGRERPDRSSDPRPLTEVDRTAMTTSRGGEMSSFVVKCRHFFP